MYQSTTAYDAYTVNLLKQDIDQVVELGKTVSEISKKHGAAYGHNSQFAWRDPATRVYHPLGDVIKNGEYYRKASVSLDWPAFIIPKAGAPYIGRYSRDRIREYKLAFQGTHSLLKNGLIEVKEFAPIASDIANGSAIRSSIGIIDASTLLLVKTKKALTLSELAALMRGLGAKWALNLDGGGSAENDKDNYPGEYERPISSALLVFNKEEEKPMLPQGILDIGHGGTDPGAVYEGMVEKDEVLKFGLYALKRFHELGVPMKATRTTDITLDSGPRTKLVRDSGAEYCLSFHINAGKGDGAELIHSIYADGEMEQKMAKEIQEAGQNVRRIFTRTLSYNAHKDYYYMHRDTGAVKTTIVEFGFIDSPKDDRQQLKNQWVDLVEAVIEGYCKQIGAQYLLPAPAPAKPKSNAPEWFVKEFGSADLGGIINDPNGSEDFWRTIAVTLRVLKSKNVL